MLSTRHLSLTAILIAQAFIASGARGETRSLSLVFGHTRESITVTYKQNGRFDPAGVAKLNAFLKDWRRHQSTKMDPQLFDILWTVHKEAGSRVPIQIVSAFRSPETNAKLRSRSRGVAKHSQHTLGRAIDFYMPDVPLAKIRELGLKLQAGGVGFYPTSGSPFVHLDTGSVRHWPRMTRQQLVRVFPQGRTLHVPSDGKPLAGFEIAQAEYAKRKSAGSVMMASASQAKNPFAFLFGGKDEAEARQQAVQPGQPTPTAPSREPVQVASARDREDAEKEEKAARAEQADKPMRVAEASRSMPIPSEPDTSSLPDSAVSFAPRIPPAPSPRPASEPLQSAALASLIAREKEQRSARALALASMGAAAKRPSIAASAPPILAKLGPIRARTKSTSETTMFDRGDLGPLFVANRVSTDDALESSKGNDLYAVPSELPDTRFSRFGHRPGRGDRVVSGKAEDTEE